MSGFIIGVYAVGIAASLAWGSELPSQEESILERKVELVLELELVVAVSRH